MVRESSTKDSFTAIDTGCNGGMDFVKDRRPSRKADPVGNAEVYKSLLLDLERFVQTAVKVFPRAK